MPLPVRMPPAFTSTFPLIVPLLRSVPKFVSVPLVGASCRRCSVVPTEFIGQRAESWSSVPSLVSVPLLCQRACCWSACLRVVAQRAVVGQRADVGQRPLLLSLVVDHVALFR